MARFELWGWSLLFGLEGPKEAVVVEWVAELKADD